MKQLVIPKEKWMIGVAKAGHPRSRTIKVVDYYFGTAGYDDINLEYNRCFGGYSNEHFSPELAARALGYTFKEAKFTKEYDLVLML